MEINLNSLYISNHILKLNIINFSKHVKCLTQQIQSPDMQVAFIKLLSLFGARKSFAFSEKLAHFSFLTRRVLHQSCFFTCSGN